MALSAQDKQIITLIERNLMLDDPRWSRRYTRHHRQLGQLSLGQPREAERHGVRGGRHLSILAAFAAWIALVCADASGGPGSWLWAALVATIVAIALVIARTRTHRQEQGRRRGCAT